MSRTGLLIALAIAAVVGIVFALFPQLDLWLVEPFYNPQTGLWIGVKPLPHLLRQASSWLVALVAAPAFVALIAKVLWPSRPMPMPGRAVVLMIATLALAPGLLTNVVLKEHWGRPRPIDVAEFKGDEHFVPWWDPRGDCPKNCSFVSGEPSGAFWTLAAAAVAPPAWRALGYTTAITFGAFVGFLRIIGGGHFFTDVVFAGVFTFLIIWVVHGLLYRWPRTRIADSAVDRAIERVVLPFQSVLLRLFGRSSK
jgi:membrane-associated PAP2 superfamily phosphatase